MNATILDHDLHLAPPRDGGRATWFQRRLRAALLAKLTDLRDGSLTIIEGDRHHRFGAGTPAATITVHRPAFWTACALGGTVGSGASYTRGDWDTDDLTAVVRILCRNRAVIESVDGGLGGLLQPLRALLHRCNRNTIEGSARNIHAHYDIGDALYARMLDPSMTYSSAIYPHPAAGLGEAQAHKFELLCRALHLSPADHLLEIGTGWGGFAIHAASRYGCRVTTTTISDEQFRTARRRVEANGLGDRITVLQQDYRQLEGRYDKLVSVEMIEAVGHEFYPTFFRRAQDLLSDDGLAVLQSITIVDAEYERARREIDFIKRFIFPGCCIPSVSALTAAAGKASDLTLIDLADYGPHYARTLAEWRRACEERAAELDAAGYDEPFRRMWRFYLCYCEGGFAERATSVAHLRFARPGYRGADHDALGYGASA